MDKLRYEIARDKPILLLNDNHTDDVHLWNECLQKEMDQGMTDTNNFSEILFYFFFKGKLLVGFKVVGFLLNVICTEK